MPGQLATLAVLICLAAACRSRTADQPLPDAGPAPTIQLKPGAVLIGGTKVSVPEDGGRFVGSDAVRQAMKKALLKEPDRVPLLVVTPSVGYDVLYDVFNLATWQYGELHDIPRVGNPAKAVRGRLQCAGSDRVWEVSAPTYGSAGEALDLPPDLLFTVAVASKGFYLAAVGGVLPGVDEPRVEDRIVDGGTADYPPTIPRLNGTLDFAALRTRVAAVKAKFPNEKQLIFAADESTATADDLCRVLEAVVPSFPDVVLGSF